jgi:hypothetical protein
MEAVSIFGITNAPCIFKRRRINALRTIEGLSVHTGARAIQRHVSALDAMLRAVENDPTKMRERDKAAGIEGVWRRTRVESTGQVKSS